MFRNRALLLSLLLGTCISAAYGQTLQAPARGAASKERLENLGELKRLVRKYYACTCDCGCYEHDTEQQSARAIEVLRKRVANSAPGERLALVLDIDDTALSNYPFYSTHDFAHVPSEFDRWVASGKAPAIPATLAIFKAARSLGVAVFFVTGRREDQREATEQNLTAAGYAGWTEVIYRTPADMNKRAVEYKSSARKKIVAAGYKIAVDVGDQMSDIAGNPRAEFSVKLPNPMYIIP